VESQRVELAVVGRCGRLVLHAPGLRVPEAEGAVGAGAGEPSAVGREGEGPHGGGVAGQLFQRRQRLRVDDLDRLALAGDGDEGQLRRAGEAQWRVDVERYLP